MSLTRSATTNHDQQTTTSKISCSHCNLPVPPALIDESRKEQFCCNGCKLAYDVIHSCGLEKYYQFRDAAQMNQPAKSTGRRYAEYDDPAFLAMHAPARGDGLRVSEFYLEGVHCAACVWLVEKMPSVLGGVVESRLNLGKALVRITWDERVVKLSQIARLLDHLGYPPHPARSASSRQIRTINDRRMLIRIGVAGMCAGNTMLLAAALYAGLLNTMESIYVDLFRWMSMAIGLVAVFWPGWVFFRGAWAALRMRAPHLDLPIALALLVGGVVGAVNTIRGSGEIYYDSLSVLVLLLLAGRFLQQRQQGSADDAVELLFSLTPHSARRVTNDELQDVPISALQIGDIVEVRPGESLPVDGKIISGQSEIDESLLTGESLPRSVHPQDEVAAGTLNVAGIVRVAVSATGDQTRVGKLMQLVAQCARGKAPIVEFADRIAGRFLLVVLLIAAGTWAGWFLAGSPDALDHAVAILIVACPCALGLATPLAMTTAIGRGARHGVLIKGGQTLEKLTHPGMLFLDKTGTLTTGRLTLQQWRGDESLRPQVAAIEAAATHPIGRALARGLAGDVRPELVAQDVEQSPLGGICGRVNGVLIHIGTLNYISQQIGSNIANKDCQQYMNECISNGLTPVLIAADNKIAAVAGLGDTLRDDAAQALASLRLRGWRIGILSGDHPSVVAAVAGKLGIDPQLVRGGLLPEQKLAIVQEELKHGPVVMVGDGVNDAAALAAATVGIAVHGGAEASLSAADVYLGRPGLAPIVSVMSAARQTMTLIRRCLAASLCYNVIAVTLAVMGLINALIAAILMPLSSLTVLSLVLASRTFKEERGKGTATRGQ